MTLDEWADISAIVQGAVVPLSLLLVFWQLRKQAKLTRAANAQSLVEIASPFNLALVQDREMAELWRTGGDRYPEMEAPEATRYINLLIWWLLLHENIYHQRREGLIDQAVYSSWQRDLTYFIAKHRLADRWPSMREFYHDAFVAHIDRLIREQEAGRAARSHV
jgi:hypothetical protein